jgi:hypothetical protein
MSTIFPTLHHLSFRQKVESKISFLLKVAGEETSFTLFEISPSIFFFFFFFCTDEVLFEGNLREVHTDLRET